MCSRGVPEFVRGADLRRTRGLIAGPWRRDGRMVAARQSPGNARHARDYYDLALEDGGVYRLLCDLGSSEWYVDGIYD